MEGEKNINDLTGAEARAVLHVIRYSCIREGYNEKQETLLGWIIHNARMRKRLEELEAERAGAGNTHLALSLAGNGE